MIDGKKLGLQVDIESLRDGKMDLSRIQINPNLVYTDKEKEENDYDIVKRIVKYYEHLGNQILAGKYEKTIKNFKLAYGVIEPEDYGISSDYSEERDLVLEDAKLDFELKFYPLAPTVVNVLKNELGKKFNPVTIQAINPEATNEIIEAKNNEVRTLLVSKLQEVFVQDLMAQELTPEDFQSQMEFFNKLPEVQKSYTKEFRLEVEKWANHQIELDSKRFNFQKLEEELFFNKLVTDEPYIHINLKDAENYEPEVLRPDKCFYLKSPEAPDVSESIMFGWVEYESPVTVINRFGHKLTEEQVEIISKKFPIHTFLPDRRYVDKYPPHMIADHNNKVWSEMFYGDTQRPDEYRDQKVRITNLYFQMPRKVGKLTVRTEEGDFSTIVSDDFKIKTKPQYSSKKKIEETLVYGEHVEWFFINELWRCTKLNLTPSSLLTTDEDIYLTLEKYPIQIPSVGSRYGSVIPVHGGPVTNVYNSKLSLIDRIRPWQVMYNFIWNRIDEIMQTEIGPILLMNQNMIPNESMGESWGKNNLVKWALTARDTGLGVMDTSPSNTGQTNLGVSGNAGQKVDMSRTDELLQKIQLGSLIEQKCLQTIGITPQFMADIGQKETATGILQGIQRSFTQIQHLYTEHFDLMARVKTTILEIAKNIAIQNPKVLFNYFNSNDERVIFEVDSINLPLYSLGVFSSNNIDDVEIREQIKTKILGDNTLQMETIEWASVIKSKSVGDLFSKLNDFAVDKQIRIQQQREHEEKLQQMQIQSRDAEIQRKLEFDSTQKQLDRENQYRIAELKVIGATQFSEGGGVDAIKELRELQDNANYYEQMYQNFQAEEQRKLEGDNKQSLEREKLKVQREKIQADLIKSQNDVTIAKVNK